MTLERPDMLDTVAVRRAFARAALTYDSAAVLQREVGTRMAERLAVVKLTPEWILDAGCGTGAALGELATRYPGAHRAALDIALPMLQIARGRHARERSALGRIADALRGKPSP